MWTTLDQVMNTGIYYCLYWAHVLIRHYLTRGRKYMLIKKYVINKHVHVLTTLYSIL